MQASNSQQKPTFQPKPLSIEQKNAVDMLVTRATDADVAAAVGVDHTTIWTWHTSVPQFMAAVEEARLSMWRCPRKSCEASR
jgi:hypothetical protein